MKPLCSGSLRIEPNHCPAELIRLDWHGRGDQRNPDEALTPFLYELLDLALRDTAAIEMHFETLEHLNASTLAVIVHFLQRTRSHGIRLIFIYRKAVRWQRLSFEALRVFEQVDRLIQVVALPDPALEAISA